MGSLGDLPMLIMLILFLSQTVGISFVKKVNRRPNWNLQPVHVCIHIQCVCMCPLIA